jgi:ParB family transcriptional regulator, chromosome partitioning protein
MGKSSKEALGAAGSSPLLLFNPEDLTLVTDRGSALFDERAAAPFDEKLVLNIMTFGVLEPILVTKNGETGKVEVVAGRRRVLACIEANKRLKKQGAEPYRIPAVSKRKDPVELMGIMVSENEIRAKDDPFNRARKLQAYLDIGKTEAEACVTFGISAPTIKNMQALLDASKPVQQAVRAGRITVATAYKLARLPVDEQKAKLGALEVQAPRDPTQKRSKNAAKAREIVDGKKRKKRRESKANGQLPRNFEQILALLNKVATLEAIREEHRKVAIAILQWVMGKDQALESFMEGGTDGN